MNCQGCNTSIDYRFLSNCAQCGCEVERDGLPQVGPQDLLITGPHEKAYTWKHRLTNLGYLLSASVVGMISGAVVFYFSLAIVVVAFLPPAATPGESCSRGMAITMLAILSGAFFGTVGGTVFAVKKSICKRPAD